MENNTNITIIKILTTTRPTLTSEDVKEHSDYIGSALWITIYCIVICATFLGNILTIFTVTVSRQLSTATSSQFILGLAISDLLVGCSIPYHMCFYMIEEFGKTKTACIIRFVLICFACSSSITNLLCVATDRYLAIVFPLQYNRYVTKKFTFCLISTAWLIALAIAAVPVFWNNWNDQLLCETEKILPEEFFNFVLTPMFSLMWIILLLLYMRIYREARDHAKRMREIILTTNRCSDMNDTKHIQVVMLTLGCFSICWMPYFIVTTYYRVTNINSNLSLLYEVSFTMAVANSGMNPIIYAWKNSNFRKAFWCLLRCQSPNDHTKKTSYITNHVPNNKLQNGIKKQFNNSTIHQTEIELTDSHVNKDFDDCECSYSTDTTNVQGI